MDFKHVMSEKTDGELLKIVTRLRNDYQQDAVAAAEAELKMRGIEIPNVKAGGYYYPEYAAEYAYAKGCRFGEYVIDMIAVNITLYIVIIILAFIAPSLFRTLYTDDFAQLNIFGWLFVYGWYFCYYFLFETYANGKTIGKWLLKTRVVNLDGSKCSAKSIAIRTLCRFIPFDALSFLWGGDWSEQHTPSGNWHDAISKTYVVKEKLLEDFITNKRE